MKSHPPINAEPPGGDGNTTRTSGLSLVPRSPPRLPDAAMVSDDDELFGPVRGAHEDGRLVLFGHSVDEVSIADESTACLGQRHSLVLDDVVERGDPT